MLLPLLVASTFEFSGGTAPELAQAAAVASQKPVVLMGDATTRLRAAKFAWEDIPDFAKEMRSYFGFRPATEAEWKAGILGFGTSWPAAMVAPPGAVPPMGGQVREGTAGGFQGRPGQRVGAPSRPGIPESMPSTTNKEPKGPVSPFGPASQFAHGNLHWFLSTIPLAVSENGAKPEEVRTAVLAALAADEAGHPRWSEFRIRYVGGLNDALKLARAKATSQRDPVLQSLALKVSAFNGLKDADIQKAFESQGSSITMTGNQGSALYQSTWNYLTALTAASPAGQQRGMTRQFQAVNPRAPVSLTFTSPATFVVTVGTESPIRVALP